MEALPPGEEEGEVHPSRGVGVEGEAHHPCLEEVGEGVVQRCREVGEEEAVRCREEGAGALA